MLARGLAARERSWYRGPICVPREVLHAARRALEVLDGRRVGRTRRCASEALAACAWAEAVAGDAEEAERLLAEVHRRGGRPGRATSCSSTASATRARSR